MAIGDHEPTEGLIVHSDRGSQYCSHEYRNMLEKYSFEGSMNKKGLAEYIPHTIMRRLRAFGAYLRMNWFTVAITKQGKKLKQILQNT